MIYKLRKKLVLISTICILLVVGTIFCIIALTNIYSVNKAMDALADIIAENGGVFPEFESDRPQKPSAPRPITDMENIITPETRFSTRFFTVTVYEDGQIKSVNSDFISAIDDDEAADYAKRALKKGKSRGWDGDYRYGIYHRSGEVNVVFVDGNMNKMMANRSISTSGMILAGAAAVVILLIILTSGRAVKPIAESYDKQRQFVTDANHELKTPLTLILANVDIAESELGENEWLSDIRHEGKRMAGLINQLVSLSRMDEEMKSEMEEFSLTDAVFDTVSEFEVLAKKYERSLDVFVGEGIFYYGDEALIRRLIAILLDNAFKYCDADGKISVHLTKRRKATLCVENTYKDVSNLQLDKLFDRFYRADKARSRFGGFGVGLSLAYSVAQRHGAQISAYKKDDETIGFKVVL